MKTTTIYRPANVSEEAARASLKQAGYEVTDLQVVGDEKAGRQFAATVVVAEFPPAKDDAGSDDAPDAPEPKDDAPSDDKPSEDKSDDSSSDEPKDDGEGDKPKEPKLTEVMDLMKAIADKLGVPVPGEEGLDDLGLGDDPMADPGADPLGLPDVGAPEAGAPAPMDKPLPPPVPEKPGGMGHGPAFSHILVNGQEKLAGRRTAVVKLADAHMLNDGEIVNEARIAFAGWTVKKIDRKTLAAEHVARVLIQKD